MRSVGRRGKLGWNGEAPRVKVGLRVQWGRSAEETLEPWVDPVSRSSGTGLVVCCVGKSGDGSVCERLCRLASKHLSS